MKKVGLTLPFLFLGFLLFGQNRTLLNLNPCFSGCEEKMTNADRYDCTIDAVRQFVHKNLEYPEEAMARQLEGAVVVSFIVEVNGEIEDFKIVDGLGYGCDEEALRLVQLMPEWAPGYKNGREVSKKYQLEVPFSLQSKISGAFESIDEATGSNKIEEFLGPDKMTLPNGIEVYLEADQMPFFWGCEEVESFEEKRKCSDQKIVEFIKTHLRYPEEARQKGIQGILVIDFVVDKEGNISHEKVTRSLGGGCDKEGLALLDKMPEWIPAMKDNEPVDVLMTLPLRFYLRDSSSFVSKGFRLTWGDLRGTAVDKKKLLDLTDQEPQVRDAYGNQRSIDKLNFIYKKKNKYKMVTSRGVSDKRVRKFLKRLPEGTQLIVNAIIYEAGEPVEVERKITIQE